MVLIVAAGCFAGWSAGGMVASDLSAANAAKPDERQASRASITGPALSSRVTQDLASLNAQRESRRDGDVKAVFLEKVSFERSAGGVVARGSVLDMGGPRALNAVIDAFDGERNYLSSASSPVQSTGSSTSFSVSMPDDDRYQSFSVRFLDASMQEVVMRSADMPLRKVAPVLADDPLHAADMGEVARRLATIGYAAKASSARDENVAAFLVSQFRQDNGLSGPPVVTIGDLLALRAASGVMDGQADLGAY
jgi:hypothetical protein